MPEGQDKHLRLIRTYTEIIGLIDRGGLVRSADDTIKEIIETLEAAKEGKASLTMTLEFVCQNDMVQIKPKLTAKLPNSDHFVPLTLWTHEGAFSAQHPSQLDIFGGPREAPKAEPLTGDKLPNTAAG